MFEKSEDKKDAIDREKRKRELIETNPDYYRLFKSEFNDPEMDFEIKLYRREYIGRGKQPKKFLKRYVNYVPTEEEIGEEFGGGTFWLLAWNENGEEDCSYLTLDERFTKRLQQKEQAAQMLQAPAQQNPLEYTSSIMKDIIRPMMEMVGKGGSRNGDSSKMVENIAESFSRGLMRMQQAMVTQKLEHLKEMEKKPVPPKPDQYAWVKDVLQFAKPFVDGFINAKGKSADWMKKILMNDPRFQQIKDDDVLFKLLYTLGCEDNDIGPDKMNELFEKAGFEVPEDEPEQEQEPKQEEKPAAAAP